MFYIFFKTSSVIKILHQNFSIIYLAPLILLTNNVLGFIGIKQTPVFTQKDFFDPKENNDIIEIVEDGKKADIYANYGLKPEESVALSQKLIAYMDAKNPYRNIDLSLKNLADSLDTYPHYITQVLNTILNQNFYDFINSYRLEEFKNRLEDPQNDKYTIIAIANDCGFSSKTTFNRIFKQKTGLTPSEHRKKFSDRSEDCRLQIKE